MYARQQRKQFNFAGLNYSASETIVWLVDSGLEFF